MPIFCILYKGTVLDVLMKSVFRLALFPTSRCVLLLSGNQKVLRHGRHTHHKFLSDPTYVELAGHNRDAFTLSAVIGEHLEYIEDIAVVKHSEYLKGNSAR